MLGDLQLELLHSRLPGLHSGRRQGDVELVLSFHQKVLSSQFLLLEVLSLGAWQLDGCPILRRLALERSLLENNLAVILVKMLNAFLSLVEDLVFEGGNERQVLQVDLFSGLLFNL